VVISDIDGMSGPYADAIGAGGIDKSARPLLKQ
jgi:hypothetical protein